MKRLAVAAMAAVAVLAGNAAAQTTTTESWPELDVYWTPARHQRTFLELSSSTEREGAKKERSVGLYQDYLNLPFGYWRAGFRYTFSAHDDSYREARGVAEGTFTIATVGQLRLVNRSRLELRWINGDYSYRVRDRLHLQHLPFDALRTSWSPYCTAEGYYDSRYGTIARVGGRVGSEVRTGRWSGVDVYVARQENWRGQPTYVDALGVTAKLMF